MKIHVAAVHHKYGTNIYAGTTWPAVRKQLAEYCTEWWDQASDDEPPKDEQHLIDAYFELERSNSEYCDTDIVELCEEEVS